MRKIEKAFFFHYPLKRKLVRDLQIVTEQVGVLEIEGTGYVDEAASRLDIFDRYAVDIDFVRWQGSDIRPVLEVTGALDEITEACVRYLAAQHQDILDRAA